MTDLYFPQLRLHIEVDEGFHKKQIELDSLREADIVNATGHEIFRIDVTKDIESINRDIDFVVQLLKLKKSNLVNFRPWQIEAETNPRTYIKKGFIDLDDDCSFYTMADACNCFGKNYKSNSVWKGGVRHPIEENTFIWFPKLYQNKDWENTLTLDERRIFEKSTSPLLTQKHIDKVLKSNLLRRIVFAKVKGPLGDVMYRYKGVFELDMSNTKIENGLVWNRTSETVRTYNGLESIADRLTKLGSTDITAFKIGKSSINLVDPRQPRNRDELATDIEDIAADLALGYRSPQNESEERILAEIHKASGYKFSIANNERFYTKLKTEIVYLYHDWDDLVIRILPNEQGNFAKFRKSNEYAISSDANILFEALNMRNEISKEEYDNF